VLPPTSKFIGKSSLQLRLRRRYGMNILAIHRAGQTLHEHPRKVALQAGDTLIFHSSWADLTDHAEEREFIVITDYPKEEQRPQKQGMALLFFIGAFALALFGNFPIALALCAGAVGMLVTEVLSMDEAYRAINWKTLCTLAALIPLSLAMEQTGTTAWLAQVVTNAIGNWPHWVLQALIALAATLAALVMSQVGATVLMVPMAVNIALAVQANPTEFALLAALGASNNFFTSGNPVISMISGPGGYRTADFVRICLPLSLLFIVLSLVMVRLLF
jgi:di/tricarboxylate transporter